MRLIGLVSLATVAAGCGEVARAPIDAPPANTDAPADTTAPDAMPDAPAVACTHVPTTAPNPQVLAYTLTGGSFESYGCAPIDPNYWMSGAGMSVTITFVQPQARPSIRVWGMNTDDTASITVNGAAYSLDATSASMTPKVVCGLSPGPDGVAFVNGRLTGANTPVDGNYSFQDITLETTGVTSIGVTGLTGAGWGFVGTSVGCSGGVN